MVNMPLPRHPKRVKPNKNSPQSDSKSASTSKAAARSNKNESAYAPAPEAVAERAYLSYENQGSVSGNDMQHWLAAESALISEHKISLS